MMSEQVIPLAVAQCFIVKFLSNKNMKPAEILTRLRTQFSDETLSRTQVYDCSKSFKEGQPHVRQTQTSVNQAETSLPDFAVMRQTALHIMVG
jgi:hypothetical protein